MEIEPIDAAFEAESEWLIGGVRKKERPVEFMRRVVRIRELLRAEQAALHNIGEQR